MGYPCKRYPHNPPDTPVRLLRRPVPDAALPPASPQASARKMKICRTACTAARCSSFSFKCFISGMVRLAMGPLLWPSKMGARAETVPLIADYSSNAGSGRATRTSSGPGYGINAAMPLKTVAKPIKYKLIIGLRADIAALDCIMTL